MPHGRLERLTVLGGRMLGGLTACLSLESATDTEAIITFPEQVLAPTSKPLQIVVLDNLSVDRSARVRELIERACCKLRFLPPYSPDLNPIEPAWRRLKALLRTAGARTTTVLHDTLAGVVDTMHTRRRPRLLPPLRLRQLRYTVICSRRRWSRVPASARPRVP
ncbi:MAG TPA: transposase [Gemmatimonadales bacterium]